MQTVMRGQRHYRAPDQQVCMISNITGWLSPCTSVQPRNYQFKWGIQYIEANHVCSHNIKMDEYLKNCDAIFQTTPLSSRPQCHPERSDNTRSPGLHGLSTTVCQQDLLVFQNTQSTRCDKTSRSQA